VQSQPQAERAEETTVQTQKQAPKRVKRVTGLGSLGISIKGNTRNVQKDSESVGDSVPKIRQKFTEEALIKEWNNMISDIAEEKVHLAETMKTHQPSLADDDVTINLTVHNNIQEKRIIEEQSLILDHLRIKLKNDDIRFSIAVDETVEEKTFFTNSEKLQRMISKNPDLNLLRKRFDLDLE
jgi:DNA polymerase III subunit gamma/tau